MRIPPTGNTLPFIRIVQSSSASNNLHDYLALRGDLYSVAQFVSYCILWPVISHKFSDGDPPTAILGRE